MSAGMGGSMGGAGSVPRMVRFLRDLPELVAAFMRWLRRPRRRKSGTLAPVIVTHDGVVVSSVDRVPLRSSKADAKRRALTWARQHFKDPAMTWGQARKAIRRFEREQRDDQRARMASAIAVRDE